jgi:hypothetical protein
MAHRIRPAAALALGPQEPLHTLVIGGLLGAGLLDAAYFVVFVLI